MKQLLDPYGPLMSSLRKLADLMFCNILFCLLCLPVFTAGAALSALYDCAMSLVEDREETSILRQYWRAFRRNFKQATLLWLICLGVFAFLALYYLATGMLTGSLARVYRVTFFLLCILFLMGFQYLFPLQACYQMKLGEILKSAWQLSVVALPWTLCSIAVPVLVVWLTFFLDTGMFQTAVFLWAALLFAVVAYLNCFFFRKAFRRLPARRRS